MADTVEIAQSVSIREAGFDEYWLQNQIFDNPVCLRLGELEAVSKESELEPLRHNHSRADAATFLRAQLEDDSRREWVNLAGLPIAPRRIRDGFSMAEAVKCWVAVEDHLPSSIADIVGGNELIAAHFEYPTQVWGGGIAMTDIMAFVPNGVVAGALR